MGDCLAKINQSKICGVDKLLRFKHIFSTIIGYVYKFLATLRHLMVSILGGQTNVPAMSI